MIDIHVKYMNVQYEYIWMQSYPQFEVKKFKK